MSDAAGGEMQQPSSDQNHESPSPTPSSSSITTRLMRSEDVDPCLRIFRDHDLVEAAHGLQTYLSVCPGGCHVAIDESSNTVIGMCIGNNIDPRVAVIGFYGVAPGYQGKGIGKKVWQEVIKFLGPEANLMLYASPAEVQMYREKAGFIHADGISMIVYESGRTITPIAPLADETEGIQILPASVNSMLQSVSAFDTQVIGVDRSQVITLSLTEPGTISFVAMDPSTKQVLGYGAMRQTNFNDGRMMLAPLYAVNAVTAKILLYNLLINCPDALNHGFSAFLLSSNPDAQELMSATGLKGNMNTPRLYTKAPITGTDETKIYSLLSPDFAPY